MEQLKRTLYQLLVEWKKAAMAGNKRQCLEIVITLQTMGYKPWPHCGFGEMWQTFLDQNIDAMERNVLTAVQILQTQENLYRCSEEGQKDPNDKVDYTFALHDPENDFFNAQDEFGHPLL